jgi:hypothetical protein
MDAATIVLLAVWSSAAAARCASGRQTSLSAVQDAWFSLPGKKSLQQSRALESLCWQASRPIARGMIDALVPLEALIVREIDRTGGVRARIIFS